MSQQEYPVALEIHPEASGNVAHFINGQRVSAFQYRKLVEDLCHRVARESTLLVNVQRQGQTRPPGPCLEVFTPDLTVTIFPPGGYEQQMIPRTVEASEVSAYE